MTSISDRDDIGVLLFEVSHPGLWTQEYKQEPNADTIEERTG